MAPFSLESWLVAHARYTGGQGRHCCHRKSTSFGSGLAGLGSAITRHSQDLKDYDRATELERIGGRLIELPRSEWQMLSSATSVN